MRVMGNWISFARSCTSQYILLLEFPHETHLALFDILILILSFIGAYSVIRSIARAIASRVSSHRRRPPPTTPRSHRPLNSTSSSATQLPPPAPGSIAILAPASDPPPALIQALNDYQTHADRLNHDKPCRSPRSLPRRSA